MSLKLIFLTVYDFLKWFCENCRLLIFEICDKKLNSRHINIFLRPLKCIKTFEITKTLVL